LGLKVSAEEEKEIRSLVDAAEVCGLRYPEAIVGWFVCFYSRFEALYTDKSRYSLKKYKVGKVFITTHLQHPPRVPYVSTSSATVSELVTSSATTPRKCGWKF
jgi:hypothetical protein